MNFAAGQLMGRASLADTDAVTLVTASEIHIEITQIVLSNTNSDLGSIKVSLYHSQDDPPVADSNSVLYDAIYVNDTVTLDASEVGAGIMLTKGESLMVKGDDGITVSAYGVSALIAAAGGVNG